MSSTSNQVPLNLPVNTVLDKNFVIFDEENKLEIKASYKFMSSLINTFKIQFEINPLGNNIFFFKEFKLKNQDLFDPFSKLRNNNKIDQKVKLKPLTENFFKNPEIKDDVILNNVTATRIELKKDVYLPIPIKIEGYLIEGTNSLQQQQKTSEKVQRKYI